MLIFQDKSFVVCAEMCEVARVTWKLEISISRIVYETG
jgi:hypothetical protein